MVRKMMLASVWALFLFPIACMNQVSWVDDYDDALRQAARGNKFVVLDISASW
jgi:hypothetical protein